MIYANVELATARYSWLATTLYIYTELATATQSLLTPKLGTEPGQKTKMKCDIIMSTPYLACEVYHDHF